ncbi:MAG: YiiX/YebB-like N1pC/P60 family cysteine hydrolase, partial [Hyphomicrobiaceae bacterium]
GRDLEFKSGDIIIMRGRAANSAAIARIGDVDSQYSHAGLVHVDPAGRAWMVEVLIEKGGVIVPLADALAHDLGRAIVLRHPDEALAHRAATIAYDRLSKAVSVKPILYDFTMELDGYKRLYCSKLVRMAYLEASGGAVRLPSYPTSLDMTNRDFFDRIGVTARRTFAPGDLEIEPSLETVAEWQDYRVTAELRLADLVMDKLFEWMETDGLRFEEDFLVRLISRLGRFAAGLSGGVKSMIDEVVPTAPPHMPRRTIAAIIMLHKTAQPLVQELLETEAERSRVFGYGLHPTEVLEFLERKRERLAGRIGYLTGLARRS